jgi:uncharacterized protein (TIGR02217 family)
MAITVLSDLVFRHSVISAGLKGRDIRRNQRVTTDSGASAVNIVWTQTLREYEIATIPLQRADWEYIASIHEITHGGAYGFLLEDPKDYHSTSTTSVTQTMGRVADLGGGEYQAYKRYLNIASGRYHDRRITRPNASQFALYISGVLQSTGYTLDAETGIVTIDSAPAAANVSWVGRFYVPVHFQSDVIDWTLEASGPEEVRFYSGPSVVFEEIRE